MTNLSLPPQHPEFSEFTLVEQLAIALCAELGWETANCLCETCGPRGTLGRETTALEKVEDLDTNMGRESA